LNSILYHWSLFYIFQFDAVELDDEIQKILKNQIGNVTKYMTVGFLGRWEPEVDALLRLIIWKVCMRCISTAHVSAGINNKFMFSIYI